MLVPTLTLMGEFRVGVGGLVCARIVPTSTSMGESEGEGEGEGERQSVLVFTP